MLTTLPQTQHNHAVLVPYSCQVPPQSGCTNGVPLTSELISSRLGEVPCSTTKMKHMENWFHSTHRNAGDPSLHCQPDGKLSICLPRLEEGAVRARNTTREVFDVFFSFKGLCLYNA